MLLTTVNTLPGTAFPTRRSSDLEHIARILGKTIFFALLALIALVAIPYGTVEPWWQAAFECGVFGLGALWLIEGFLSGSYHFSTYRILLPIVALALFGLLQTVQIGYNSSGSL